MATNDVKSPLSLKYICLGAVGDNKCLSKNRDSLPHLPTHIIRELYKHVSPYGLYLLDQLYTSPKPKTDHLFLTQWTFPKSYALKARARCRESFTSTKTALTNKQFFYDSLLNEVVEQLMYGQSIDESLRQACLYFTQCQDDSRWKMDKPNQVDLPTLDLLSIDEFIILLSSNVSSLTITSLVSHRILQHQTIFTPILRSISHINLNLLIKSSRHQNVREIIEIIKIGRKHNLRSISIKLGKESVLNQLQSFQELASAVFSPLKNPEHEEAYKGKLKRTNLTTVDSLLSGSSTTDDIYENLCAKRPRLCEESASDLYDFVFASEPKNPDVVIDTNIFKLKLCASENPFYATFFDYISQWKSLQILHIEGYYPKEDTKIKNAFLSLERYNSLRELTLSEFWFPANHNAYPSEKALIQLARSSCSKHEVKKSLKKLRLMTCCYSERFVSSLFSYEPSQCCIDAQDGCVLDGLDALEITLFRSNDDSFNYISEDCTLKELIIHKYTWNQVDNELLDAIGRTKLRAFILNSKLQPLVETPQNVLELLGKVKIQHLELSHVCRSDYLFQQVPGEAIFDSLKMLHLSVFVWTRNGMKNSGLKIFSEYLPFLQRLRILDLSGNLFDIEGVTVFLQVMHRTKFFLDKLNLGGPNVRSVDIERSGLSWIVEKYTHFFLASYVEEDRSDHIAQM